MRNWCGIACRWFRGRHGSKGLYPQRLARRTPRARLVLDQLRLLLGGLRLQQFVDEAAWLVLALDADLPPPSLPSSLTRVLGLMLVDFGFGNHAVRGALKLLKRPARFYGGGLIGLEAVVN